MAGWLILLAVAWVWLGNSQVPAQQADRFLDFYCRKAGEVFEKLSPVAQRSNYSIKIMSSRCSLGRKGEITRVDSAVTVCYYTGGTLDSQSTSTTTSSRIRDLDYSCPNVFGARYHHFFYPNDTGGPLAIGFDTDAADDSSPVGLAIIDRHDYTLRRLYLFYPRKEGYKRYSRILYMGRHEGWLLPDSIVEQGSKLGFLSTDYYRLKMVLSEVVRGGSR